MQRRKSTHRRSRRAQYVNQACVECKRRKTRCDGFRPCGGCTTQSVTCVYLENQRIVPGRSPEYAKGRARQSSKEPPHPNSSNARSYPSPPSINADQHFQCATTSSGESPVFCGPSSTEFMLKTVRGNLNAMGMPFAILEKPTPGYNESPFLSHRLPQYGPFTKMLAGDPLWDIKMEDATRLIKQWCEGVGSLYPIVSQEEMMETANRVFTCLRYAQTQPPRKGFLADILFDDQTTKLKIVLAIGRTLENGGKDDQAQRLFQSTTEALQELIWNPNGISGIQLLVLAAQYHYHLDDDVSAARIAGFAARLCLEMGLHRREMVERIFPSLQSRMVALQTFWSAYMLERRTCLGQGIPFSLQDSYVDPSLFALTRHSPVSSGPARQYRFEDGLGSVLPALLDWTKLAGKTWEALNNGAESGVELDDADFLNYEITQWYEQLPEILKLNATNLNQYEDQKEPSYLQLVLYFRKSHLQNLISRPVLQSEACIKKHEKHAILAIEKAKDTIQAFADINDKSSLIRTHPIFFKHPLLAAFGNLLLAIANGDDAVRQSVRAQFSIALDLIQLFSTRSSPLMRLWHRLQGLRELQSTILKLEPNEVNEDANGSSDDYDQMGNSFDDLFMAFPPLLAQLKEMGQFGPGTEDLTQECTQSQLDVFSGQGNMFEFPFIDWN